MRICRPAGILAGFAFALVLAAPKAVADQSAATSPIPDPANDPYANATLWTLIGDYAHIFDSALGGADFYGLTGTVKVPLDSDLALHFEGGYHHVTFANGNANDFTAGGSLVLERQDWHFGPQFGFQASDGSNLTANTFNYGGFAQFYTHLNMAISGWAGGFHTDFYKWNGFYVGGDAEWYPAPDFAITPEINFVDSPGRPFPFREADYIQAFEWRPISDRQVSIYAAYAYTTFSTRDHANTIYIALKFYNGAGDNGSSAPLLLQRYEAIDVSPIVTGLAFKY